MKREVKSSSFTPVTLDDFQSQVRQPLYILVKHNHKFMEGLGEYATIQGNPALRATKWSGEIIFLMVNRILSSHSDFRVPLISGIVKIRALGESFFKQLHDQYASPKMRSV